MTKTYCKKCHMEIRLQTTRKKKVTLFNAFVEAVFPSAMSIMDDLNVRKRDYKTCLRHAV